MNDPSTSIKSPETVKASSILDDRLLGGSHIHDAAPAICRICRGEGTASEPLFYPCKCSGSIKYVHQDCLMEWLSHSQKKHCELCKTSFRFTKLYAPDMPRSLPVHVFLGHMTKYLFRNALVWLRAVVAISVWICWLPYFMRSVWSFMFWISDEGLVNEAVLTRVLESADRVLEASGSAISGVCPSSPLFVPLSTSASATAAGIDEFGSQGAVDLFVRLIFSGLGVTSRIIWPNSSSQLVNTSSMSQTIKPLSYSSPTLLSEVGFLRNLTGNATLHRSLVSVLEGQLITVLVILSFILVILVRDYVIQQQPEINMRAVFPLPENQAPEVPRNVEPQETPNLHRLDNAESDEETLEDGRHDEYFNPQPADNEIQKQITDNEDILEPHEPLREALPGVASLTAQSSSLRLGDDEQRYTVSAFFRVYRQAEGDPERMQRIAEEEGLQNELLYWIDAARKFGRGQKDGTTFQRIEDIVEKMRTETPGPSQPTIDKDDYDDDKIFGFGDHSEENDAGCSAQVKGKANAWYPSRSEPPLPIPMVDPQPGPSRTRAASDGPRLQDAINPLGSNNWSFSSLVEEAPSAGLAPSTAKDNLISADLSSQISNRFPNTTSYQAATSVEENTESIQIPKNTENGVSRELPDHEETTADPEDPREEGGPEGLVNRVTNFMWGDLYPELEEQPAQNEEQEDDLEDQWVDVPIGGNMGEAENDGAEAIDDPAAEAGLEAEAIDDLDDFDGIMELIGMRGPIAGLFQNAIFCSVLVSVTIFTCVFIPYNIGRVSVWILAKPMMVVRMVFELSKLLQDTVIMLGSLASWAALYLLDTLVGLLGGVVSGKIQSAKVATLEICKSSGFRVLELAFKEFPASASEMQNFSAISHGALISIKGQIGSAIYGLSNSVSAGPGSRDGLSLTSLVTTSKLTCNNAFFMLSALLHPGSWVVDLGEPDVLWPVDPELAYWPSLDRFWAIVAGYVTVFCVGALYLRRGMPFSTSSVLQAWEVGVIDTLHQASGIMKVILIISIEMLIFPLYCGLLLDVALLPLFEDATVGSRIQFSCNYPLTSIFVHWFAGTGYMFHFALFVSMCRKIMRSGVLYFIRDPDDPEFHPVRDVLERNLTTQLRKILFSAFVYGALVLVCLGCVVWGLATAVPSVVPIHYSSNEPILEFPVDLLFYNFLMPQAVNFLKPGDGLHSMYTWWFRTLARSLRLTYFLFGERRIDEEGTLRLSPHSSHRDDLYQTLWLELDEKTNEVAPKTWRNIWEGGDAKPNPRLSGQHLRSLRRRKTELVESGQLVRSGRFVRAPASDHVKIPMGKKVFLTVTERDSRRDDKAYDDLYASNEYQVVYVPPQFGMRIFLFILFIWIFAAVTGVGFTILPLLLGRQVFKALLPHHIRTNDIYAFSIGIYILGSLVYVIFHVRKIITKLPSLVDVTRHFARRSNFGSQLRVVGVHAAKLTYAYFFLVVVFPLVASALMELYVLIPLHTYLNPPKSISLPGTASENEASEPDHHNIRIMQAWTLGILYLKVGARMITGVFPDSRLAVGVRTVLRQGWLRPDVGVLSRAFIIPGLALAIAAILVPPGIAAILIKNGAFDGGHQAVNEAVEGSSIVIIYRHSYPITAFAALLLHRTIGLIEVFKGWTARIRDEAYLIGERLHNFGAVPTSTRKGRAAWRAGGPRL